jgi:hypothetical protein
MLWAQLQSSYVGTAEIFPRATPEPEPVRGLW